MRVSPEIRRFIFHGLNAKITYSRNPSQIGIEGRVIDETKSTFVISKGGEKKTIAKNHTTFHFEFPDSTVVEFDGKILLGRPEERVKKLIGRVW
ncbi:ribonuclease P protein subunit [Candidatus Bathyarchaeota archaeon]|jgi:ribonuclease P protein subunit POP4|nr:ribonuclease P protein subunit [Candidatus Bathyarchaeota archaeon]